MEQNKKGKINLIIQIAVILIGIILMGISIPPFLMNIRHIGVVFPFTIGVGCVLLGGFHQRLCYMMSCWTVISRILFGCLIVGLLILGVMSAILAFGFDRYQKSDSRPETVVVLGCKIKGRTPSYMLQYRLDCAYNILKQNPQSVCVVSGGQGDDEICPESEVMAEYLEKKGIDPSRIYEEDQSSNTKENLEFSLQRISDEKLPEQIVVATDFYHQYRANYYARTLGAQSCGASCYTNPALVFSYWVREILGVWKAWFLES